MCQFTSLGRDCERSSLIDLLVSSNRIMLVSSLIAIFGIQWTAWLAACLLRTEKFYDLTGSLTYLLITLRAVRQQRDLSTRQLFQAFCVGTWAVRLGSYLFLRVLKDGRDRRFDRVRGNPRLFLVYWTMQGFWVAITLLPSLLLWKRVADLPRALTRRDYCGYGLWCAGFLIEAVADHQKFKFRSDPANKGKFISHGLWSLSRHPNYFGEILMWFALFMPSSVAMSKWEWLSVLCPVFDALLITRISGIPLLEKHALRTWGNDPTYQAYVRKTPILVPFVP